MPSDPNKLVRFFRELRRRRVFRTFAMYGATAFILMEAADIMLPRLGLPEWTVTFVIVLLIIGFPIALVLSWIFDVTPEGIQKTAVADEEQLPDAMQSSGQKQGFTLSHAIIIVLLVVVGILVYPKIFPGDQYKTVRNEAGQITLAVLPFANQTGDSSMDWLSTGISSLLTNGLGSSEELMVYNDQGMGEIIDGMKEINTAGISGPQAKDIAGKTRAQAYITGSYQGRGDTYRILANLVSTEKGDILHRWQAEGNLNSDAYLDLADSLCRQIRDQLEIRALEQEVDFDFRKAFTSSSEAYRYYIQGMNAIIRSDFVFAVELMKQALEIDSTFAFAAFSMAMAANMGGILWSDQRNGVARAHALKSGLPMIYQQWIDLWVTCIFTNDPAKLKQQISALESSGIESRLFWLDMGITQVDFLGNPDQALKHMEKVDQISERRGEPWHFGNFHLGYGKVLREMDRCQEAEEHFRQGLELTQEVSAHRDFLYGWAICAVSRGDSALASQLIEEYRLTKIMRGETDSYEYYRCIIYHLGKDYKRAESEFRLFLSANPDHARGTLFLARTLIEGELDPQEGLDLINTLLDSNPEDPELLYSRAFALHKLGRHQEALELLEMNHPNSFDSYKTRKRYLQEVREAISADL